ncbi:MAG: DUF6096 family protein, partial [Candidatus Ornithomonoglobus sp.]
MLYTTLKIGEKDYKLRMSSAKVVEVEKEIKKNPLDILIDAQKGILPLMSDTIAIFWGALTYYQHGINREAVYDIYDEYIAEGHTYTDFIQSVLLDIFITAGYFKKE